MLSGASIFGVVDACLAGIHYDINIDAPDNYQTACDGKTKIAVFYSFSNAFDFISGCKFREEIYPNTLK